jgi:sugar phosphate isomerase/epimerase
VIEIMKRLNKFQNTLVNYIQLCDAPTAGLSPTTEQLIHTARSERLVPGSGEIDLIGMIMRLYLQGKVYSVEVPRDNDSSRKNSAGSGGGGALSAAKFVVEKESS